MQDISKAKPDDPVGFLGLVLLDCVGLIGFTGLDRVGGVYGVYNGQAENGVKLSHHGLKT